MRALQLSLCLCCLSSASNAIAQTAQGGVAPGRSYSAPASSTLLSSSIATTCTIADTNTTDLWTFNLPANTLNEDGKTVRITAWGTTAANVNNKTEQATFGGTVIATRGPNADSGFSWVLRADVMRTGASAQLAHGNSEAATTGAVAAYVLRTTTIAADNTQPITLKVTGLNGTASAGDVCVNAVFVELLQSTTNNIVTSTGGPVANPILLPDGSVGAPAATFANQTTMGLFRSSPGVLGIASSGAISAVANNTTVWQTNASTTQGFGLRDTMPISWNFNATPDLFLYRDAAATLAQRNGTNAQAFKVYNTFTDASNYERAVISWAANTLSIGTENAGTGVNRNLQFTRGGVGVFNFNSTKMNLLQDLWFNVDNTLDIGASGANRPRNIFLAGAVNSPSGLFIGASGSVAASSDGTFILKNNAGTDFTMLQLGGTGVGFPAIKKSGTALQARLADDSGYTDLVSQTIQPQSSAITSGAGTGITVGGLADVRTATYKVTITSAAFTCLALTCDVTVGTLPAKTKLEAVYADLTTTFACTATCTTATLSFTLGSTAGGTDILSTFDADAAVLQRGLVDADLGTALARATAIQGGNIFSWTAATPLSLRLISATGNIGTGAATNLSQGSITVYLVTTRIP